jgi:hypothetical protein
MCGTSFPAEKIQGQGSIALYPRLKKSKYGRYKEAWRLLRGKKRGGWVDRIEACGELHWLAVRMSRMNRQSLSAGL